MPVGSEILADEIQAVARPAALDAPPSLGPNIGGQSQLAAVAEWTRPPRAVADGMLRGFAENPRQHFDNPRFSGSGHCHNYPPSVSTPDGPRSGDPPGFGGNGGKPTVAKYSPEVAHVRTTPGLRPEKP